MYVWERERGTETQRERGTINSSLFILWHLLPLSSLKGRMHTHFSGCNSISCRKERSYFCSLHYGYNLGNVSVHVTTLKYGLQNNKWHKARKGGLGCLMSPPVWNLRAVIWFHFAISSLVLLPSPVTLSVLSFSACWPFLLNFFKKILQYFSLRDRLLCMAPV